MPATWVPLLPSEQAARAKEEGEQAIVEQFMTAEQKSSAANVMTGVGLMTLGIFVALLFAWAYSKDRTLFIAVMGAVAFAFSANMLVYVTLIRGNMSQPAFNYYLGLTIFMTFMNLLIFVLFTTIYMRRPNVV